MTFTEGNGGSQPRLPSASETTGASSVTLEEESRDGHQADGGSSGACALMRCQGLHQTNFLIGSLGDQPSNKCPGPLGAHWGQGWDSAEKPRAFPGEVQQGRVCVSNCALQTRTACSPFSRSSSPLLRARRWARAKSGPFHLLVTTQGICFANAMNRGSERQRGCSEATERG